MRILLVLGTLAFLQAPPAHTGEKPRSSVKVAVDSPHIPTREAASSERRADSLYIAFLEKVNQQVALSSNPLAAVISALGVLFTVLGLVAAYLIFRQSADFKKAHLEQIASFKKLHDDRLADNQRLIDCLFEETKATSELLLKDFRARLVEVQKEKNTAGVEEKVKILEEQIARLEMLEQGAIRPSLAEIHRRSWVGLPVIRGRQYAADTVRVIPPTVRTCIACGRQFDAMGDGMIVTPADGQFVICPYCEARQRYS